MTAPPRPAAPEPVLDVDLPICDGHHHLWRQRGATGTPYLSDDLRGDTASGHDVIRTRALNRAASKSTDTPSRACTAVGPRP